MTTGFILIFAVLILGGVIATAGDRIGMRVGKARLSLFQLRPRQTATLITILTGGVISASTLGLLFAVSEQLRTGVFELENIQDDLTTAQSELSDAEQEKRRIEDVLADSRQEQRQARESLRGINDSLQTAIRRQQQTESELNRVESNYQQAQQRLQQTTQQATTLRREIEQLQAETQSLLDERDRAIAAREREIADRERQLRDLEEQRTVLERDLEELRVQYAALREGNLALSNNEVMVERVAQVENLTEIRQNVLQLLLQANQVAISRIAPGEFTLDTWVLDVPDETEQLILETRPGMEYLFRVNSGGNYLVGEPCVLGGLQCIEVEVDIIANRLIFAEGEVIASATLPAPSDAQSSEIPPVLQEYGRLLDLIRFRARQSGALGQQLTIANDQVSVLRQFLLDVAQYQRDNQEVLTLRAIAARPIQTADTVSVHLEAFRGDRLLFSTVPPPPESAPSPSR
ncbi:MAG: DUF3084 domain-containing protein [Elainellaceae cyanobacterium]